MRRAVVAAAVLAVLATAACSGGSGDSGDSGDPGAHRPSRSASDDSSGGGSGDGSVVDAAASQTPVALPSPSGADERQQVDAQSPTLGPAVSRPRRDSVYPLVGDGGVDALHYGIDLAWTPSTRTLVGDVTLAFRATTTGSSVRLDLSRDLTPTQVTLDGQSVRFDHPDQDLVVDADVVRNRRYTLEVRYSGVPRPAAAPTVRDDVTTVGWTTTDDGGAWTMQEPYGAYTWYPVDDQPADKAFYDISVTTEAPMNAVANGQRTSFVTRDGLTTSTWHLDSPAASYLVTVAIGDYQQARGRSPQSHTPISYWVPKGSTNLPALLKGGQALDWVESWLGPYPFSSLGFVLVDSTSGMETQTMITLGDHDFDVDESVLVHELVHQWYGDEVTPGDWRDVWMNEGMAMYLQIVWQAEHDGKTMDQELAPIRAREAVARAQYGPPADYDPSAFAESNVYFGPALMWQALRDRIGDQRFRAVVRAWPAEHPGSTQDLGGFVRWLVARTGAPRSFFDQWLRSPVTPGQPGS